MVPLDGTLEGFLVVEDRVEVIMPIWALRVLSWPRIWVQENLRFIN